MMAQKTESVQLTARIFETTKSILSKILQIGSGGLGSIWHDYYNSKLLQNQAKFKSRRFTTDDVVLLLK